MNRNYFSRLCLFICLSAAIFPVSSFGQEIETQAGENGVRSSQNFIKIKDPEWEKAVEKAKKELVECNEKITANPFDGDLYVRRGYANSLTVGGEAAIKDYTKAIKLGVNTAEVYYFRGHAFYYEQEYGKSIEDFTKSVEINPNNSFVYKQRGLAFWLTKKEKQAIKDLTRAIELNPKDAKAYFWRANVYSSIGAEALADADFDMEEVLDKKP